jgi:hypothetical protein
MSGRNLQRVRVDFAEAIRAQGIGYYTAVAAHAVGAEGGELLLHQGGREIPAKRVD